MKGFKQFVLEKVEHENPNAGSLHVLDVDDTLVHPKAQIHVVQNGERVKSLHNSEFNTHKLEPDQHYDFSEFRNSDTFSKSAPIQKMISKVKAIHKNISSNPNHRIIINTARSDMDNKHTYLNTFKKFGLPINDIHVYRAGNDTGSDTVAVKKANVISKILEKQPYKKVHVYDDGKENLDAVHKLKQKHPETEFHTYHVQHDGSVKKYKPTNLNEDGGAAGGIGGGGGNTVGGGAIAGVGVNNPSVGPNQGEPGVFPKHKKRKSDFPKSPVLTQILARKN